MARGGFVYILTNRPGGVLYIGVTADLAGRMAMHRVGSGSRFVHRYNLHRLVYVDRFEEIEAAVAREKQLKRWNRAWKVRLIEERNPEWADLFDKISE